MSTASDEANPPRLVALHLPQFHPMPENDAWWGEGFTEWSLVRAARPLFPGHPQPREPADLGYYDLAADGALEAQAALAQRFGVDAFCFYHYWFAGRRLLERPVETMLRQGSRSCPSCSAGPTRTGRAPSTAETGEILMAQTYPAGDAGEHARALAPYFSDPRYVTWRGGRCSWSIERLSWPPPLGVWTSGAQSWPGSASGTPIWSAWRDSRGGRRSGRAGLRRRHGVRSSLARPPAAQRT